MNGTCRLSRLRAPCGCSSSAHIAGDSVRDTISEITVVTRNSMPGCTTALMPSLAPQLSSPTAMK